jgi:hypothetical protein
LNRAPILLAAASFVLSVPARSPVGPAYGPFRCRTGGLASLEARGAVTPGNLLFCERSARMVVEFDPSRRPVQGSAFPAGLTFELLVSEASS